MNSLFASVQMVDQQTYQDIDYSFPSEADLQLRHVSLAQRYAFDLCTTYVNAAGGDYLLHTDSDELPAALTARLQSTGQSLALGKNVGIETELAQIILWYAPVKTNVFETVFALRRMLKSDGQLVVVGAGWLHRFAAGQSLPFVAPQILTRWLAAADLQVEAQYGFHSPQSIAWGVAANCCDRVGQLALADRCHFAMRRNYINRGLLAALAPLYVLVARPC